jgi:Ca2+-binding EF-hand superfamily protein
MKGINKITFAKYIELPGIINDRLFAVFDKNKNDYLDSSEFIQGMSTLYTAGFEILMKFIFDFYDFDKDGKISKEDVRIVLSYIPLNTQNLSKMKFEK